VITQYSVCSLRMLATTAALLIGTSATVALLAQDTVGIEPAPTTWTNDKGVPIEAEFVRMTDAGVVLKLTRDGREAAVPLTKLSIESIYQAVRLANPAEFSKPIPKAEVKVEGPELPELNLTVEELLQSPFKENSSIEQFFETLERLPEEGNFFVGWHTLPPKMQNDIEDLIIAVHQKLGASTMKQIQVLLGDLNTIATEKKKFVLGLPKVGSNPQLITGLDRAWPLLSGLTTALSKEEHWQASNFQKGNVPRWLAKLSLDVAPIIIAAQKVADDSLGPMAALPTGFPKHTIVSQSADTAEVELTVANLPPVKKHFQKLGNIWIDVKDMNELRHKVDEAKENMASGGEKEVQAIRAGLSGLIAVVGGLARANSQEDFTQAVALLQTMTGGLTQAMGGPAAGSGNSSGSGSMGSPYGGTGPPPGMYNSGGSPGGSSAGMSGRGDDR
jgi:hypothetical protein